MFLMNQRYCLKNDIMSGYLNQWVIFNYYKISLNLEMENVH